MKITESKLREMIRGVIREFTTTATAAGAKKKGYKSSDTKSKEATYDTKKATYDTKSAAVDDTKHYRKAAKGGGYTYSAGNRIGYSVNPDWTTQTSDRASAETARDSAETEWDSAKEADLQAEVPTQKPPAGGAGGFGKGKSAGKGKGKKKKD